MHLPGRKITPDGRVWLESTRTAHPLHLFSQVVNLRNPEGELISVSTEEVGLGPFALSVSAGDGFGADEPGFTRYLKADSEVEVTDDELVMGALSIAWRQAEPWNPRPDWAALRAGQDRWRSRADELHRLLLAGAPPGGLTALLVSGPTSNAGDRMTSEILAVAREAVAQLEEGLARRDEFRMAEAAAGLAGLGGGLTPSGDDYLIGTMHALWAILPEAEARTLSRPLAHAALPRTTDLSGAWIYAAAAGEAGEYWHDLFEALLREGSSGLEIPVRRLLRVGHTSGADALAGFLVALDLV